MHSSSWTVGLATSPVEQLQCSLHVPVHLLLVKRHDYEGSPSKIITTHHDEPQHSTSITKQMLQRTSDCSASIRARASLCGGHNDHQNEKRGQVSNGGTGHPIATPKDNCSSETTKHTTNAKQCNSLFQEAFPWSLGSGPQGLQTLELWHQPWLLVTHVPRKCILGVQVRLLERSSKQNPILSNSQMRTTLMFHPIRETAGCRVHLLHP